MRIPLLSGVCVIASICFARVTLPPGASGIYTPTKTQPYTAYRALWRTNGGFQSTIRLTNMLVIGNMDAQATLYMADGTAYPLPPVRVPASGVATLSVNEALAAYTGWIVNPNNSSGVNYANSVVADIQ